MISGTDEVGALYNEQVLLRPGPRKIYVTQYKVAPQSGDIISAFLALATVFACYDAPDKQCIEFSFQAEPNTDYWMTAGGYGDYHLVSSEAGEVVSSGIIVDEQLGCSMASIARRMMWPGLFCGLRQGDGWKLRIVHA